MALLGRYNASQGLPRGFIWIEEDGTQLQASQAFELVRAIGIHRHESGNGDMSPGWEERIGDDLCYKYELQDCGAKRSSNVRRVNMGDISRFAATLRGWAKSGMTPVNQEIADKRAETCAKCPYNVEVTGCSMCKKMVKTLFPALKDKRTTSHESLQSCSGCGCVLRYKVYMPADALPPSTNKPELYHEDCWVRDVLER